MTEEAAKAELHSLYGRAWKRNGLGAGLDKWLRGHRLKL